MSAPDDAGSPIREINAVTLATADMAASVSWYRAIGFEVVGGGHDADFTTLRAGAGFLNLQHDRTVGVPVAPWGRVVVWVADVDAAYQRAVAAGSAPGVGPADAPWGERFVHVRDPSGHEISLAQPL